MTKIFPVLLAFCLISVAAMPANPPAETKKTAKPITMNRKMFIEKVFDYENNSNQWIYAGDKPAVIDFWAPWCGPCRQLSPVLEELAAEYGDKIYIYKINVDNETELAQAFGIQSIPTLLFIPMQGTPHMAQGAIPKASFRKIIDEMLLNKKAEK